MVDIKPIVRDNLVVNYGETEIKLPGTIPVAVLEMIADVPKPQFPSKGARAEYNADMTTAALNAFIKHVLPYEYMDVIDAQDLPAVAEAWYGHVKLGERSSSDS